MVTKNNDFIRKNPLDVTHILRSCSTFSFSLTYSPTTVKAFVSGLFPTFAGFTSIFLVEQKSQNVDQNTEFEPQKVKK